MKTYTVAMIGCGKANETNPGKVSGGFRIGYYHAKAYAANPRTKLVAAVDINKENLAAFQKEFNVPRGFADYRQMLKEVSPDVVSICTFVGLHREMIEVSAKAGVKGILCEKPFVNSPADLVAVKNIAEETGVKLCICHQRRTQAVFDRARQIYNDGTVGAPVLCLAGIQDWDLSEWGSHWLDMFRFFHNDQPVQWVMGQARVRGERGFGHAMEQHAVATFQFTDGSMGMLDGGHGFTKPDMLVLLGTQGTIRLPNEEKLVIDTAKGRVEEDLTGHSRGNGWQNMVDDLVAWLDGGDIPQLGLPRTYGSAELNLATYVSVARGDRVDLPLDEEALKLNEWPLEPVARRNAAKASLPK